MALKNTFNSLRFFLNPLPLGAILLMALNDHWLKYEFSNVLTGKLSDFCGVFYLPIFLLALVIAVQDVFSDHHIRLGPWPALIAIGMTDLLMLMVKTVPSIAAEIENFFRMYLFNIQIRPDLTDLWALSMNFFTYTYLRNYWICSKDT